MSNIAKAFENGKAFIPFITCGDPDLDTTAQCIVEMQKNGASIVELGIPFSDPTAEGPVIMEASLRALTGGCTTDKVFEMVKRLRTELGVTIPMVFMTYANVVFSYGIERFCQKAKELGVDGMILPDVPYEEKDEFDAICKKYDLDLISLIAPTSNERISMIATEASGFIYIVSSLGVTGVRSKITTDVAALCTAVKSATNVPCAIGFGISTPEQAAAMAKNADGVIVGSAIVKIVAQYGKDAPAHVGEYVKSIVDAIK
ncbi:MAG: tryptophan synthase subunit alpha [Saccharofermentans sp.]|nr:tryptophan synthase subunit alpha [Saccharofermentans sp.]